MNGKTCIVTGASSGIGKETAVALAEKGASLHIVCRSRSKGEATVAEIRQRTGSQSVTLHLADLSSQADIHALADRLNADLDRIDVLVNNAGVAMSERVLTVDGIETTFAVNHLAYFLLTNRLLEKLAASAPSRIVSVASDAHRTAVMNFDDPGGASSFGGWAAYCQSKLANILFTRELARRLDGTNVTANCLHPGVVGTNLGASAPFFFRAFFTLAKPFLLSNARGARTSIYLASSPDVEGVTGGYFSNCRMVEPTAAARDDAAAARLWHLSEELTGVGATTLRVPPADA